MLGTPGRWHCAGAEYVPECSLGFLQSKVDVFSVGGWVGICQLASDFLSGETDLRYWLDCEYSESFLCCQGAGVTNYGLLQWGLEGIGGRILIHGERKDK
jgi:hypothetical protein